MKEHHMVNTIAKILLIVGGLNWGLIGLFHFNLIGAIFGDMYVISRIIYILVGLAAVCRLVHWIRCKKK